jgi:signal transduction histidine kinase
VLLSADVVEFDGQPCVLTVAEDITERKQAELERRELSRRLMTAQEAERRRIARELHDGIGQSLALLGIQVQRAGQPSVAGKKNPGITDLCAKVKEIGTQVSHLSHQLHSSELEFLGLAVAVKGLCREFSEQYRVTVNCSCKHIPEGLDNDIALCMLRVVQEALHNIAKHSRATTVSVEMMANGREIALAIRDDGVGFDVNQVRGTRGLGLVSMRERMHLIGGQFQIKASLDGGTRIEARAPLAND